MKHYEFTFKILPIEHVERDLNQPRKEFGINGDENRLLISLRDYGMEEPIKVSQLEENRYIIMDGHRRYICAQRLGWKSVPCRVYPKLSTGEFESRRFEMQNNRRSWRPLERSESLERIKNEMGFRTNRELANFLHLTETLVANSLQLRKQKLDYTGLMEKYDLQESYRIEFVRLKPKIRKIREFEADDIIKILFEKVKHKVIKNAKDFRKLGRVFLRATANEMELYHFLSDLDVTVDELEKKTTQSGFSLLIEQLMQKVSGKVQTGTTFSAREKKFLEQLRGLLNTVF